MKHLDRVCSLLLAILLTNSLQDPGAAAQFPAPRPSFEAASLKPTSPEVGIMGNFLTRPGGRLELIGCPLELIIRVAYEVDNAFQILEAPRWVREDRFDLTAVPPPGSKSSTFIPKDPKLPPPPEELEMLKTLIAERFQMEFDLSSNVGPSISTAIQELGLKLTPSKGPVRYLVIDHVERLQN